MNSQEQDWEMSFYIYRVFFVVVVVIIVLNSGFISCPISLKVMFWLTSGDLTFLK